MITAELVALDALVWEADRETIIRTIESLRAHQFRAWAPELQDKAADELAAYLEDTDHDPIVED